MCVNIIKKFVYLALDKLCLIIKKRRKCINKKVGRYGINWLKVCALTCGNEELCSAREDRPSDLLYGKFHNLIPSQ